MKNDCFNNPLLLINKKPNGNQMISNGYGFFMIPTLVMEYANKTLKDTERRLYYAISGQADKDKNGKQFYWAISHYCKIANIKSNHYSEVLQGLVKKGFIIHNKFESIEVLYPISEFEFIKENGQIENTNKLSEQFSQVGNEQQIISSQISKEDSQKSNCADKLGNQDSSNCANNREININKEERESLSSEEKEYESKVHELVSKIANKFDNEEKIKNQLNDLRQKGFSFEFIFLALDNKKIEDFSMGIGLLFKDTYQKEINIKIQKKKEEQAKQLERLAQLDLIQPKEPRIVKAQKRIMPEKRLHLPSEFEW